ncbi:MAG: Gfo/Idh/MocA family oxidoreductase [Candidatus Curtissbacteria bacterium]
MKTPSDDPLFSLHHKTRPIIVIGAGGIVKDAHLPAYRLAGFNVAGIYDINVARAKDLAEKFSLPEVYYDEPQMLANAPSNAVFDLAVPGHAILDVLQKLPDHSAVLIQKPMGENYEQAKQILKVARDKNMIAGVNFQLRYAPFIRVARELIRKGLLGELWDIEVNVNVYTPWELWDFLFGARRVEILYHSIHYIDLIRSFLGNPLGLYAKTRKHPHKQKLASVRSNIIMDYGDITGANISTNHCHNFGIHNQQSYIKFEGTKGAIKIQVGLLLNYPVGLPDKFEYVLNEEGKEPEWKTMEIDGSWFPHAFIGPMSEIMKAADGSISSPDNSVEDCIFTMACVEAAYESSKNGERTEFIKG